MPNLSQAARLKKDAPRAHHSKQKKTETKPEPAKVTKAKQDEPKKLPPPKKTAATPSRARKPTAATPTRQPRKKRRGGGSGAMVNRSDSLRSTESNTTERKKAPPDPKGRSRSGKRCRTPVERKGANVKGKRQCPDNYKVWFAEVIKKGIHGLREEFQSVRSYTRPGFTQEAFQKFAAKNRYKDVICMEETRVKLTPDQSGEDYIHASHVKTEGSVQFICAQGPTDATTADFWRMINEYNCGLIIMLCDVVEQGKAKCSQYWPKDAANMALHGTVFVKFENSSVFDLGEKEKASITQLSAINMMKNETRSLHHICWTGWPDKSVPSNCRPVLALIEKAQEMCGGRTVVVHCSAGIGRTGTLVALYMCLDAFNRGINLDIPEILRKLRDQRLHSVQTELQYIFIYRALIEYFNEMEGAPKTSIQFAEFLLQYRNLFQDPTTSAP